MDQAQIIEEFHQGRCIRAYQLFGAHFAYEGGEGVRFTVYAPHAHSVSVIGSFNDWDGNRDRMTRTDYKGVWSVFVKGVKSCTRTGAPRSPIVLPVLVSMACE